jgi:hypothetical protein
MKRIAEAHLTDSAWDQKEAESMLPSAREVHPSRKHSQERRAPRKSQQKSRMKVRDDDLSKSDSHLSLSSNFWGLFEWPRVGKIATGVESVQSKSVALNKVIADCHVGDDYIKVLENDYLKVGGPIINDPSGRDDSDDNRWDKVNLEACIYIIKKSRDYDWRLNLVSNVEDFNTIFAEVWNDDENAKKYFQDITKNLERSTSTIVGYGGGSTAYDANWPKLVRLCHRIGVAGWIYNFVHKNTNALVSGLGKGEITEELLKIGRDPEEKITKSLNFASFLLKQVHEKIRSGVIKPEGNYDPSALSDAGAVIEEALKAFVSIANTVAAVNAFRESLQSIADDPDLAAAQEPEDEKGEEFVDNTKALESILSKLESGDNSTKEDLKPFVPRTEIFNKLADKLEEQLSKNDGWKEIDISGTPSLQKQKHDIQERISKIRRFSSTGLQISNGLGKTRMNKVSAYQGVVHQGHPSGATNTDWKSVDKRYLNKTHFDSIVACAKEYLGSSWFKSGWDDGAVDARVRAALDLAITMADGSIYQSKIDATDYNRLFIKLSGEDISPFEDTLIPDSSTIRKASVKLSNNLLSNQDVMVLKKADIRLGHTSAFEDKAFRNKWDYLLSTQVYQKSDRFASDTEKSEISPYTLLLAAESLKNSDTKISEKLIGMAANIEFRQQLASRLAVYSAKETDMADVRVAVDLNTLVRVAYNNPAAREELLPIIAKATKGKLAKPVAQKKKSSKKKDEEVVASKKSSSKKEIGKAPKGLTSSNGKKVKRSSRKASIDFSSDDLKW